MRFEDGRPNDSN